MNCVSAVIGKFTLSLVKLALSNHRDSRRAAADALGLGPGLAAACNERRRV